LACSRAWILIFAGTRIPETEDAWLAAILLAQRAGDVGYQLHALVGLAFHSMNNGRLAEAAKWLNEFSELSERHQNWSATQDGERLLAWSKLHAGELAESRRLLEGMAARYPRPNSEALLASFQMDPYIGTRCYLPLCAWLMGQRDHAATVARQAVDAAGEARNLFAQSHALTVAALTIAFFDGDPESLAAYLAQLQFIHRQTTPGIWVHATQFFGAVLKDLRGEPGAVAGLQAAIGSIMATRYRLRIAVWFGTLADALARQGRLAEAGDAIDEAIRYQVQQDERWCRSELLRIKASILRRTGQPVAMESMLREALQEAHAIGALSFELRAANDLAAHYLELGRRDDAAHLLLPILRRFSEGFGAKDLIVAAQLLKRTGAAAPQGEAAAT
jgi:tetratricopeptide (TPR) repeat protein